MTEHALSPGEAVAHLQPAIWAEVNIHLIAKAIAELAHELVIEPVRTGAAGDWTTYAIGVPDGDIEYRFRAQVLALDHWWIDARSLEKRRGGALAPLDATAFVVEMRERLKIPAAMLPAYLQEITTTLYGAAYKRARGGPTAEELTRASFQEVEAAMTEGHPIFIANNGRIGFNAIDYRAFAPEVAAPVALVWLAAHRERTSFACTADWSYDALIDAELGTATREAFETRLRERGLAPESYLMLPVHPWQWQNRIIQLFAADLATGGLVYLGTSDDQYQAQQSIRTFFNLSAPQKRYVKTALSILNMGFTRGISPAIANRAAAVNDWVASLVEGDPFLRERGFDLLREVAFIGYRHRHYEKASAKRSDAYKELCAAQWRESPIARVAPNQQLMTMATLMHRDRDGASVLVALIRASGLGVGDWLRCYMRCYLQPLLHCFYAHQLVFSPHCENVILVLEGHAPVGAIIKDIAEDIGVLAPASEPVPELPAPVRHLALRVPDDVMTLSIFTDVFDCVFRFLAQLLYEQADYPVARFWHVVAEAVRDYERAHPELATKVVRYDLFAPTFIRNCLNRLQLTNHEEMVDLNATEPVDSLQFVGTLVNPIAAQGAHHGNA